MTSGVLGTCVITCVNFLVKPGTLAGVVLQHMVTRGWGYWGEAGQALRTHWQSAGRGFPGVLGTAMTVGRAGASTDIVGQDIISQTFN